MNESEFGQQYFNIFGTAKDTTASNILTVCRQENIDDRIAMKIVSAAQTSIEQTASNAYPALWKQIQKFFRK